MQALAPTALYVPATQSSQPLLSAASANVPASQSSHASADVPLYFPDTHTAQKEDSGFSANLPAVHDSHTVACVREKCPVAQIWHSEAPSELT